VGQYRHPDCKLTLGLPDNGMAEARASGANTMMIGTANAGGVMAPEIVADAIAALDAGLNVVAGLHQKLRANPDIVAAARRNGRVLFDARDPAADIPVGTGRPRAGRRLLTVIALTSVDRGGRASCTHTGTELSCDSRSHIAASKALRAAPAGSRTCSSSRPMPATSSARNASISPITDATDSP
jgi:hypothetical protein